MRATSHRIEAPALEMGWWAIRAGLARRGHSDVVLALERVLPGAIVWQVPPGRRDRRPSGRLVNLHGTDQAGLAESPISDRPLAAALHAGDPIIFLEPCVTPVLRWDAAAAAYVALRGIGRGEVLTCDLAESPSIDLLTRSLHKEVP